VVIIRVSRLIEREISFTRTLETVRLNGALSNHAHVPIGVFGEWPMDLDQHWRSVRRLRAKRKHVPNVAAVNARFREAIFERMGGDWFRDLSNADFAKRLNALGLMTFQGRTWDATSARIFRTAIEADIANGADHLIDEEQLELRRIQGIRDRARDAILRSQAEDQPLDVLETDIILIRLDLLEDRNSGMKDVLGAIELLERKLKVRQASTGSPPRI
jgi:hypothetical protein